MLFMISGAGGEGSASGGGTLPVRWEQDLQIIAVGHGWQAFENVGEPGFGVVAMPHGIFQQGMEDGSTLAGAFAADKEPVLLANGWWTEGVFEVVVINFNAAVGDVEVEARPQREGVGDRFAHGVAGKDLALELKKGLVKFTQYGNCLGLPDAGPLFGAGAGLPQLFFYLIDMLDVAQRRGGRGVPGFEGFVELAPGVCPAGSKGDAGVSGSPRVIGGVAVGLEDAGVAGQQVIEAGGAAAGVPLEEDVSFGSALRGMESPIVAGGAFSTTGIKETHGAFVGLQHSGLQQVAVGEFVEGVEGVGGDVGPAAKGVAGKLDAMAILPDGGLAVERQVVAKFGDHDMGDKPRGGAEARAHGGWRGAFDGRGVRIGATHKDGANEPLDEDGGGLIVEAVGFDPVDLAPCVRAGFDGLGDEHGLTDFEPGEVAGFARGALAGGGSGVSRRCVGFSGGVGFFCGFGVQQQFELGGVERLVLLVEKFAQDQVEPLAQQLVFMSRSFQLGS